MISGLIAQESPCEDETYLELKKKKLDKMSEREYEYFTRKDKECSSYSPIINKDQINKMVKVSGTTDLLTDEQKKYIIVKN